MKIAVLTSMVAVLLSFVAKAQFEGGYEVDGTIARYKGTSTAIWVYKFKSYDPETSVYSYDSFPLVNGRFVMKGKLEKPEAISLSMKHTGSSEPDNLTFFVEKGKISISTDSLLSRAKVEGSAVHDLDLLFANTLSPYRKTIDSLYWLKKKKDSAYVEDVLNPAYALAVKSWDSTVASLINMYPRSYRSVMALDGMLRGAQSSKSANRLTEEKISMLEQLNGKLQEYLKGTPTGMELDAMVKGLRNAGVGDQVLHFSLKGTDGKAFDTKNLKGRIFLIDFWGSWCVWCRKGHPHLKELYEKYRNKGFEIVAVAYETGSHDEQVRKWKKAIEEDAVTWRHVLNGKGENDIVTKYGIGAFPTKLLVDKNGTILLRVTDDADRKLDAMLEQLL